MSTKHVQNYSGDVRRLKIADVIANPNQPRKNFDPEKLKELAASIKEKGLIQPILVRPIKNQRAKYMIVAGERRFRAHKIAGLGTIRAIVKTMDEREMMVLAMMENMARADMSPVEEARGFQAMIDNGFTTGEIVKQLGLKSPAIVNNRLQLLELQDDILKLVDTGQMPHAVGWGISQAPKPLQASLLRDYNSGRLKTAEQVRHAGIAMREAASQVDAFASLPKATPKDVQAMKGLEASVDRIKAMVVSGFKDGECIAAQRVSPDRTLKVADTLAICRKHMLDMEQQLRNAGAQRTAHTLMAAE